jgi:hypothetical protein
MAGLVGKVRGRVKQTEAERRAAMAFAEARDRAKREQQSKTNDTLLARKQQRGGAPTTGSAGSILNVAPKPAPTQKPAIGAPPRIISTGGSRPVAPPPAARGMTTAERLAQKRREKK